MADQRDIWAGTDTPPHGFPPPPAFRQPVGPSPSGLFPTGPQRPRYREPHRIGAGWLLSGGGAGMVWLLLLGILARDLRGYAWWTAFAGGVAWAVAAILARMGDRGVAVGVAISTGIGWSIAAGAVAVRWVISGDWPMW
jgi:hypothetical protein